MRMRMQRCANWMTTTNSMKYATRLLIKHSADSQCTSSHCMAVVLPLVETAGRWVPDRTLVPLLSLGRRVVATEGSGAQAGTFSMAVADAAAGGSALMPT